MTDHKEPHDSFSAMMARAKEAEAKDAPLTSAAQIAQEKEAALRADRGLPSTKGDMSAHKLNDAVTQRRSAGVCRSMAIDNLAIEAQSAREIYERLVKKRTLIDTQIADVEETLRHIEAALRGLTDGA